MNTLGSLTNELYWFLIVNENGSFVIRYKIVYSEFGGRGMYLGQSRALYYTKHKYFVRSSVVYFPRTNNTTNNHFR